MRGAGMTIMLVLGAAASPGLAAEHAVRMAGASYVPERLDARVGDTIRFVNEDATDHQPFVPTVGFAFDLGKQEPGTEKVYRLGKPGRFEIECVVHQDMLAIVEVRP
jgi:plastocyanin